jgi:hypothetical protein
MDVRHDFYWNCSLSFVFFIRNEKREEWKKKRRLILCKKKAKLYLIFFNDMHNFKGITFNISVERIILLQDKTFGNAAWVFKMLTSTFSLFLCLKALLNLKGINGRKKKSNSHSFTLKLFHLLAFGKFWLWGK